MKTILITACLVFLVSCQKESNRTNPQPVSVTDRSGTQTAPEQPKEKTDSIEAIRKEYNSLHALLEGKKLTSKSFSYNCDDEITGEVKIHSDKGEIKVIEHSYAEHDHFSASEQYYIKDGNVFFIFRDETVWMFGGGTPEKPVTRDDVTETRIYLRNGQPIRCLEKKYVIKSDVSEKPDPSKITGKEVQCSTDDLMKTYHSIIRNKDRQGKIKCL